MARFLKKLLSNKTNEDGDSYTSAHLGEENNFYFNEELNQWVVRGEEDKVRQELNSAPPPPSGKDLNYEPSVPPSQHFDLNGSNNSGTPLENHSVTPTSNPLGRRVVRSSQLYTNIPGMNVFQEKPMSESFVNIPTSSLSQFIPSKDDFDASLVNDAYADLMNSTEPVQEETTDRTDEQMQE